MAKRPCPQMVWWKKVAQSSTLDQAAGIEPGTFWLAVRDLTNYANLAHTIYIIYI